MKKIKIKCGNLHIGPFPSENDLKKYGPFDIIWNLSRELASFPEIVELEERYCDLLLFGDIEDYSIPEDLGTFLNQINIVVNALNNNKKVFVHCIGGRGRTGMILSCLKSIIDDISPMSAINFSKHECNGPEMVEQCNFVLDFMRDYNAKKPKPELILIK